MAENPFAYQKEGKEGLPDFGLSIMPHMGRGFFFFFGDNFRNMVPENIEKIWKFLKSVNLTNFSRIWKILSKL
jgi:hypothetical protein